jgi:hypothetical protein
MGGYIETVHRPVRVIPQEQFAPVPAPPVAVEGGSADRQSLYQDRDYRYEERQPRHERSTGKSVAIVAGSAAGGAAIGALAGGGKGAGVGALAGGAGGFIYDRLTHHH